MMYDLEVYVLWLIDNASFEVIRSGMSTSAQRSAWARYINERTKVDYWLKGKQENEA